MFRLKTEIGSHRVAMLFFAFVTSISVISTAVAPAIFHI
jgi:hypothetical protein